MYSVDSELGKPLFLIYFSFFAKIFCAFFSQSVNSQLCFQDSIWFLVFVRGIYAFNFFHVLLFEFVALVLIHVICIAIVKDRFVS